MFSRPKILFLVSLLFVALLNPKFNPYLLFKFLIFIILVNVNVGSLTARANKRDKHFRDMANDTIRMNNKLLTYSDD